MSFPKMNTRVNRYKAFEAKPITMAQTSYLIKESFNTLSNDANEIKEKKITLKKEEEYNNRIINENITKSRILSGQIYTKIASIEPGMRNIYFKKLMGDFIIESLVLDKDFVLEHESSIRDVVSDYIDHFGGYKKFLVIEQGSKSPLLNRMKNVCEKMSKKSCNRKLKEAEENNSLNMIDFSISYDEEDDFESMKGELDIEKISELVKDKVITVIKDEKERESKEKEVIDNIRSELEEENEKLEDEEIDVEESLNQFLNLQRNPHIEEGGLFYSLMNQTYRMALESKDYDDDDDDEEYDDDELDDTLENEDADDCDDDDDEEYDDDDIEENTTCKEINMDKVLSEAIVKYTIMEMFYTLQLESYTFDDMKKITTNILNEPSSIINESKKKGFLSNLKKNKLSSSKKNRLLITPKQLEKLDVEKTKQKITNAIDNCKNMNSYNLLVNELSIDAGLKSLKQRYPDVSPELVKKALAYDKWLNTTAKSLLEKKKKELSSVK